MFGMRLRGGASPVETVSTMLRQLVAVPAPEPRPSAGS